MEEEKPKIGGHKAMSRPHLVAEKDYTALKELFSHHIESFDHMVDNGLETMLLNIKPIEIVDSFSTLKLRNILFLWRGFILACVTPFFSCQFYIKDWIFRYVLFLIFLLFVAAMSWFYSVCGRVETETWTLNREIFFLRFGSILEQG